MHDTEITSKQFCPACGQSDLSSFYRVDRVPINSCLLFSTAREAQAYPEGNLELAVCHDCGFITNVCFDSARINYSAQYEDQQSFSPTFNAFSKRLAERLVADFGLYGKDIVEIGCGKGDFLKLLCALGDNRGTGIDPSISIRQTESDSGTAIRWVAEHLRSGHREFSADFFCCRHTLEHIHDVSGFTQLLRDVTGDRKAPLFLEVPDTERVLKIAAFEDIYHEHCSYFTTASLRYLIQAAGYEIIQLYKAYDDQYLMLDALPAAPASGSRQGLDSEVAKTLGLIDGFRVSVREKKRYWTRLFEQHRQHPVALWGSGSKCVSLLSSVKPATENITVVDINPHRHGKYLPGSGLEIQAPDVLRRIQPRLVIAMNSIYLTEIRSALNDLGLSVELCGL